jgi:hypothetical protein
MIQGRVQVQDLSIKLISKPWVFFGGFDYREISGPLPVSSLP